MKQLVALVPVLMLAGCGGGGEEKAKQEVAANLTPGQRAVTREVTAFRATDNATPQINAPVGTRTTESICVAAGDRPPGELFAGAGYQCEYGNYYMRSGRINVSLSCRREGLNGEVRLTTDGSFQAEQFEANVETTTFLTGEGDSLFTQRVTGRRTGDCTTQPGVADNGSSTADNEQ